jgi:tRNA threonylcarbamoyladenosine biosynthesis protein TsaB
LVLGLDTAGERSSAALARGDTVLGAVVLEADKRRGESLAASVGALFETCGVASSELDALAVVTGPGSYTGLRVGLALARGLAIVDDLPLVGLSSLELLALAVVEQTDAKRT